MATKKKKLKKKKVKAKKKVMKKKKVAKKAKSPSSKLRTGSIRKAKKGKKVKKARAAKKVSKVKKATVRKIEAKVKEKILGRVTHYYDKIGVAIVDLESPMRVGDMVKLSRGEMEMTQVVSSMQIEHAPVLMAKKGDVIGIKVTQPVREGTVVKPV